MLVRERHTGSDDDPDDSPIEADPRRRAARRGVLGALAGALIMLLAATALAATGQDVGLPGLSTQRSPTPGVATGGDDEPPPLTAAPGACLTWSQDDASDVREVDCASSHLFENVGAVTASQPPGSPFPADAAWQRLVTDQCTPLARTYLQGKLDPAGRYRAGALKPTQAGWNNGDRTVRCGMQAPGRSGALFSSAGRVAAADQAVVFADGACLGLAGKEVADPVACASSHAAEVAGTVDLGTQFRSGFPSVDDQDNYLQPTCARIAEQHVGSAQKLTDSKLTVYWTNIAQESWDAGTRRVSCNLGSLLPDNSGFAPLTGRAADGVTIGGPAQPSPVSEVPGAPAEPTEAPASDTTTTTQAPAPAAPSGGAPGPNPVLPVPALPLPGGGGGS